MSGIVGKYHLDHRPLEQQTLQGMITSIAHRGPDGQAVWTGADVGLGQCLLHTTPESLYETLPLVDRQGELVLVADARIDNREELIRVLNPAKPAGRPVTDAELILASYQKWGRDCPERLLGDFAFVIWDGREQRLFCAVDHYGIKQLYFYHAPGRLFAFASEIKALLELEDVPRAVNTVEVARHLLAPVEDDLEQTYYHDIFALRGGHTLTVDPQGVQRRCYWTLETLLDKAPTALPSDEAYAEALREIFIEAVRCRMRSATPVSSMLSGGLDSSSITCVAAQLQKDEGLGTGKLRTLSAIYDDVERCDERRYIDTVVDRYDLQPYFMHADSFSVLRDVEQVHRHLDFPLMGGNSYIPWHLYETAGQQGSRVVLDGFDGDSTLSHGTGYWFELAEEGRWLKLVSEVKHYATLRGQPWGHPVWTWVRGRGILPLMSRHRPLRAFRPLLSLADRWVTESTGQGWGVLNLNRVWSESLQDVIRQHQKSPQALPRLEREAHYQRLISIPVRSALRELNNAAAAHGVEVRMPFFDKRMLEFCLPLPPEQKLSKGWERVSMRRAMEGILPEQIQWRAAKTDMTPGVKNSLERYEQERLSRLMQKSTDVVDEYVNPSVLKELFESFQEGNIEPDALSIFFRISTLTMWLQNEKAAASAPMAMTV